MIEGEKIERERKEIWPILEKDCFTNFPMFQNFPTDGSDWKIPKAPVFVIKAPLGILGFHRFFPFFVFFVFHEWTLASLKNINI